MQLVRPLAIPLAREKRGKGFNNFVKISLQKKICMKGGEIWLDFQVYKNKYFKLFQSSLTNMAESSELEIKRSHFHSLKDFTAKPLLTASINLSPGSPDTFLQVAF
jgi:hypothetical protein